MNNCSMSRCPFMDVKNCDMNRDQCPYYTEKITRQMEQWKPIITDDDLPPIDQRVLVTKQNGEIEIAHYGGLGVKEWQNLDKESHVWVKHHDPVPKWWYAFGALSDEHPLAWMPLPEPYISSSTKKP